MAVYLAIATIPIIIRLLEMFVNSKKENRKQFLIICGIALFLAIALRHYSVGSGDSTFYYKLWGHLGKLDVKSLYNYIIDSRLEPGYLITVWGLSHLFPNPQFSFVLSGLFFVISICYFIYQYSDDPALSLVMYITLGAYVFMVQGMRQAIAMCICLWSVDFCLRRKFLSFVLIILIATSFHKTAIIFLLMYFIVGVKVKFKTITLISMFLACSIYLAKDLIDIANQAFELEYSNVIKSGGFVATAIYVICIIASYILVRNKNKPFSMFFYMTMFGLTTYVMRYVGTQAAERISFYFIFGQIIVLPKAIQNLNSQYRGIIKILVYILCIALFAYRLIDSNLLPYYFFWQK